MAAFLAATRLPNGTRSTQGRLHEPSFANSRLADPLPSTGSSQSSAAPGRVRDYVVNGRMIGGFGVIAWPVRYGDTGVMTFIVNQDGVVYQQDLGPQTAEKAGVIASFNPDKGWVKADMTPP